MECEDFQCVLGVGRYFMYVLFHMDVKYKDFVYVLGLGRVGWALARFALFHPCSILTAVFD